MTMSEGIFVSAKLCSTSDEIEETGAADHQMNQQTFNSRN